MNWHHEALCNTLDRWLFGDISRLMVFMPPRHGKSELVSRRLPAYLLGRNPDATVIACSYAADLAQAMNRDVQRIVESPGYAELFPGTTLNGKNIRTLSGSWMRNSDIFEVVGRKGMYRCAGVGGGITGMGFTHGIIDDPIKNAEQALSETHREKVWEWYTSTFYTRQMKGGRILLTVTRWHEDDLPGRLLRLAADDPKADQWHVLTFPAEAMPAPLHPADKRRPGEALWPQWFGLDFLSRTRAGLGSYQYAALYQQQPTPAGGAVFKGDWFNRNFTSDLESCVVGGFTYRLDKLEVFAVLDPAASEKQSGDYTAIGVFAITPRNDLLILDMVRERLGVEGIAPAVKRIADKYRLQYVAIESNGFQVAISRELRRMKGIPPIKEITPLGKGKLLRATEAIVRAESGQIWLLKGANWISCFLDEVTKFTGNADKHDDQVDVLAYACRLQSGRIGGGNTIKPYVINGGAGK